MKRYLAVFMLAAFLPLQAQSAEDMTACMRKNILPGAQVQDLELEATDIQGQKRTLTGKMYSMREDLPDAPGLLRANIKINAPSHLAGAAFLLKETEDRRFDSMYVYLPAVRRVRRISAEFSDGPLLGTNFSYYEFKQMADAFGDLKPKVDGEEEYEGRKVKLMSYSGSASPTDPQARYSSVKLRVDTETCVVLTAEFMKGGQVRKRLSASPKALRKTGKFWYLSEIEMRDMLDDTSTVLRVTKHEAVPELPGRHFGPNTFYLSK